jgi:predicted Zn finger-like uncharacterized protein
MLLSCPNCLTEYDVPDTALAGRARRLRCARCGHQWQAGSAPEPVAAPLPIFEPAPPQRTFGHPVDDDARAGIEAAARQEGGPPLRLETAEPNTVTGLPLSPTAYPEEQPGENQDGFAALVRSARTKPVAEDEASTDPDLKPRTNSRKLIVLLLVLLIIAAVLLGHSAIIRAVPGTRGFFHALGLA